MVAPCPGPGPLATTVANSRNSLTILYVMTLCESGHLILGSDSVARARSVAGARARLVAAHLAVRVRNPLIYVMTLYR